MRTVGVPVLKVIVWAAALALVTLPMNTVWVTVFVEKAVCATKTDQVTFDPDRAVAQLVVVPVQVTVSRMKWPVPPGVSEKPLALANLPVLTLAIVTAGPGPAGRAGRRPRCA